MIVLILCVFVHIQNQRNYAHSFPDTSQCVRLSTKWCHARHRCNRIRGLKPSKTEWREELQFKVLLFEKAYLISVSLQGEEFHNLCGNMVWYSSDIWRNLLIINQTKLFIETNETRYKFSTQIKPRDEVEVWTQPFVFLRHEVNRVDPISKKLIPLSGFPAVLTVRTADWFRL